MNPDFFSAPYLVLGEIISNPSCRIDRGLLNTIVEPGSFIIRPEDEKLFPSGPLVCGLHDLVFLFSTLGLPKSVKLLGRIIVSGDDKRVVRLRFQLGFARGDVEVTVGAARKPRLMELTRYLNWHVATLPKGDGAKASQIIPQHLYMCSPEDTAGRIVLCVDSDTRQDLQGKVVDGRFASISDEASLLAYFSLLYGMREEQTEMGKFVRAALLIMEQLEAKACKTDKAVELPVPSFC